jgi:hypothetical protein
MNAFKHFRKLAFATLFLVLFSALDAARKIRR